MRLLTVAFLLASALSAFTGVSAGVADALETGIEAPSALTANYNPSVAMEALFYAKASYCTAATISSWSCPACYFNPGMKDVQTFTARDTQAFVGYDSQKGNVVVAIRGSANIQNWLDDLTFTPVPYPPCGAGSGACKVHKGFYDIYTALAPTMVPIVKSLMNRYPAAKLFVTGHSLGASVSTLAALDLYAQIGSGRTMYHYNFGSPRIGDPAFVKFATQHLPSQTLYRMTHKADPVPHVPPMAFGFLHSPHEIFYDNDSNSTYKSCDDGVTFEDKTCSNHYAIPIGIADHTRYLGIYTGCVAKAGDMLMRGLPAEMAEEFNRGYVEEFDEEQQHKQLVAAFGAFYAKQLKM